MADIRNNNLFRKRLVASTSAVNREGDTWAEISKRIPVTRDANTHS